MVQESGNSRPMLNAYPDSLGGTLSDITQFLKEPELQETFGSIYILPSLYNTDLDRGFSVIDYGLNEEYVKAGDLDALKELGIDLKLDFILNHASVLSKQFQDILKHGEHSKYADFFINWNKFWEGHGKMNEKGYIEPDEALIQEMFFRKPGLPILMVKMPDGTDVPYWNTFYQEVRYEKVDVQDLMQILPIQYQSACKLAALICKEQKAGANPEDMDFGIYKKYKKDTVSYMERKRKYLGQMDLNVDSPLVWEFYDETLRTLSSYGAKIVRLDAFAYASKILGEKNFMNDPGTWDLLKRVQALADAYGLQLLPEIHASYETKTYALLSEKGYMTYDFFLPGLIIDSFEQKSAEAIVTWAKELKENDIKVVNMLGCHDGIPLLDLAGLLPEERIQSLINTIVERGGLVKNLHGQKNVYYQVNATYYSALGEEDRKLLLARAIQLFMPGKPQIWYLDLLAGKNDYGAVEKAGEAGHKEINRTNLTTEQIKEQLALDVVQKQLEMIRFRNQFPAFGFEAQMHAEQIGAALHIEWNQEGYHAVLDLDLEKLTFTIKGIDNQGKQVFSI